jgi:hypothetical protein
MPHTSRRAGSTDGPRPSTYLVEHYWPGISAEIFRSAAERVRATAESMARDGTSIRFRHSTLVPTDEAAFCVLDADSAELIEQLYARAGVRFERIVAAVEI